MITLAMLWLPILLSAVFVFIASSILHMALPIHKADYRGLPDEANVRATIRNAKAAPGQYMFPHANSMKECSSPEMIKKQNEGPVGVLILRQNGQVNMGKLLGQWFVFSILVSVVVAYLPDIALAPGAGGVFRFTATAALLAYGFSDANNSIWKGVPWDVALRFIFDGVVYALVTGATFAWLWPAAV